MAAPDQTLREAIAANRAGRFEAAREKLAALDPPHRDLRAWQELGLTHRGLLDSADAHAAFAAASRLAPADPLIAHSLARTALEAGYPATALFDRARALAPSDAGVILGRVSAQLAEGEGEAALADLATLLAANPAWIDGHHSYAKLAAVLGAPHDSTRTLRAALVRDARSEPLWLALVQVHLGGNDYASAARAAAEARAAIGPIVGLDRLAALALSELGAADDAQALLDRLPFPANADEAITPVRNLVRLGRLSDAQRLAEFDFADRGSQALWPYRALLWRLSDDPRWQWLEGDPRLIGIFDLSAEIDLAALADCLRALHRGSAQPLDQSVRGGTQTDGHLFARAEPEIRRLRCAIEQAVREYAAQLPPLDPAHPTLSCPRAPIRFAGAWSVRLAGAGFHADHVHTHGWLSSACYIALPDTVGDPAEAGWLTFGENLRLLPDLPAFRTVRPEPGKLVLFPSIMWHGTRPFAAGERLTVAFDVARPTG